MTAVAEIRFHLSGLVWMLVAGGLLFITLLYINESAVNETTEHSVSETRFEVKPPERPKPKKIVKQKSRPQKRSAPPPAPLANLDTSLSGIDFGLPAFQVQNFDEVDKSLLGNTDDVVMTSEIVDVPPLVKSRAPLDYPARAKRKEIEGYVVLSLLINENGEVKTIKIIEASPRDVFEEAAMRSVERWQFSPARYDNKPVQSWANQTIRFQLG